MESLFYVLPAAALGFAAGLIYCRTSMLRRAAGFGTAATRSFREGYVMRAVVEAAKSLGLHERHEGYKLVASGVMELGLAEHAALFWNDAFRLALKQDPKPAAFYLYAEASAYDRAGNPQLAHARADEAIRRASAGEFPFEVEGRGYEEDLRAARMVAAASFSEGDQVRTVIREDAGWIQAHGSGISNRQAAEELLAEPGASSIAPVEVS